MTGEQLAVAAALLDGGADPQAEAGTARSTPLHVVSDAALAGMLLHAGAGRALSKLDAHGRSE